MKRWSFLLLLMLLTVGPLAAQAPYAQIVWPPSTYVLSGQSTIYGTANAPGMTGYYLEFRQLINPTTPAGNNVPWAPATLPTRTPVINGVLGVWDTTQTPDGLYELRLTIFTTSGQPVYVRVSPLRVMNTPSPFVTVAPNAPSVPAFATPLPPTLPPPNLISPPTAESNTAPEVIATIAANVRAGDSTEFLAIGALALGEHAPLLAVSAYSSWWQIRLPDGQIGWVAPSVVQVTGNWQSVPRIVPPRPTPTNTPVPTATPALPDLTIASVNFDHNPKQGQQFHVIVTVFNNSGIFVPTLAVACNFTPMNAFFNEYVSNINPYAQVAVSIPAQLNSGGGTNVTANCAVDVNNLIAESNEANNYYNVTTTLQSP